MNLKSLHIRPILNLTSRSHRVKLDILAVRVEDHMKPFVLFEVGQAFGLSDHLIEFLRRAAAVSQTLMMMKRVRGLWGWRRGEGCY